MDTRQISFVISFSLCVIAPDSNLRQNNCQYDDKQVLTKCELPSSCTLRLENKKTEAIADNFHIINMGCKTEFKVVIKNLKVVSLGGLPDALKKQSKIIGIGMIELGNCQQLDFDELVKIASLMHGGVINIYKSLAQNKKDIHLAKLINKKEEVKLNQNGVIASDKIIDASTVKKKISIIKTEFRQKNVLVFNDGVENYARKIIKWKSNKINPHFVETSYSKNETAIYLEDSNKFLRKDTFMNVRTTSVRDLQLQDFDRIEYGTVTNGTNIRFLDIKENNKQLFTSGECTKISDLKICEVCLIHQYALHRSEDSVEQKCKDKVKITNQLQKCYWSEPESIPCSLQQPYEIFDSWIDKSVPVCSKLPQDITEHLTSVKSDEKPEICPTTTTKIPTTTSSNTTKTTSASKTTTTTSSTTSTSIKTTTKTTSGTTSIKTTTLKTTSATSRMTTASLPKTNATISKTESSTKPETSSIPNLISLLTSSKSKQSTNVSKTGNSTVTRSFPTENFLNSSKEVTSMSLHTSVNENSTAAETTKMPEQNQTTTGNEHLFTTSMKLRPSSENEDKNVTTSKTSNSKNQSSEQESFQTSAESDGTTTSGQQRTYTSRHWEVPSLAFDYGLEKQESFEASSSMIPTIFGKKKKRCYSFYSCTFITLVPFTNSY